MSRTKLKCFVIMPFGKKTVGGLEIDFDLVWDKLIRPAVEAKGIDFDAVRVDQSLENGAISPEMIRDIYNADVAIADVTYHNPNVFYELGIRHALAKHGTVLIKRSGGTMGATLLDEALGWDAAFKQLYDIPFDLKDVAHCFYEMSDAQLEEQKRKLGELVLSRHKSSKSDSPVFTYIPKLRVSTGSPLSPGRYDRLFRVRSSGQDTGKIVGYRSGDIANLDVDSGISVDYWVNSENTMMQMARMNERSMSSTIRHLGARDPDPHSPTYEDSIQDALKKRMGNRHIVDQGEVLITDSFRLRRTHGVKALFHAATVTGKPRSGFEPISEERTLSCISEIIRTARRLIQKTPDERQLGTSMIMPLFGSGQARRDPSILAGQMIYKVIQCLRQEPGNLNGRPDLDTVLFSAFSVEDVQLMRRLFNALEKDGDIVSTSA